ncbi:S9 family peptidase [Chromatiaceae bacterium AAb-1]|nr:S9 family peptidase [Chromatiaceae bacterium AAb-1]
MLRKHLRWFSLIFLVTAGIALARPMTLEETVSVKSVSQTITSNDGNYTAFIRNRPRNPYAEDDGVSHTELFVLDSKGNEHAFVTGAGRVAQPKFSADSQHIYFLTKRGSDKFTSLYRIAVDGGEAVKVFSHSNNIQRYDLHADGKTLAFLARPAEDKQKAELTRKGFKAEVYEENLPFTQLFLADLTRPDAEIAPLAISGNVLSAQFRPQQPQLLIRTAPTPLIDDDYMASQYQLITLDGSTVQIFDTSGKLDSAVFSPDGSRLAIIGSEDINDPSAGRLLLADISNGKTTDAIPGYQGHVQDLAWRSDNQLLYVGHTGTEAEVGSINLRNNRVSQLVKPGNGIATRIDIPPSGKAIRLLVNKAEHPAEVYSMTDRGALKRLTNSNPWLKDIDVPRQQTVTHKAADGTELEGVLVYPLNYVKGQRYPLIMVVHGGPEAHISNGWLDRYGSPVKHAAAEGYMHFFPNYRGSTGRGVEFSKLGQNDYAGKEFDDLVDAKNYLVAQGLADAAKVGITGGSYGGFASAWAATKQTEHFAASVMFVGISNNLSKFGTTDISNEMYLVHARSYPWQKWQWYLERSPIYYAEQARTPILIMHGKEDTRVHPSQSIELYRYLKVHGNVPVRLVLYPGEGHGNTRAAAQLDYGMRLMQWMDHFLKQGNKELPSHELPYTDNLKAAKKDS